MTAASPLRRRSARGDWHLHAPVRPRRHHRDPREQEVDVRVLYGVTGEGLGRRDALAGRHRGADPPRAPREAGRLRRASGLLSASFPDVVTILRTLSSIAYRQGTVARGRTVWGTTSVRRWLVRRNVALYEEDIRAFDPELCVSDFDSFAHLYGKSHRLPVVAIDHQHVLDRRRPPPAPCDARSRPDSRPRARSFARRCPAASGTWSPRSSSPRCAAARGKRPS